MPQKIIRDPVHDVIALQTERPLDRLLFGLINAAEFQRLRRIRQLGFASLAYPGADHSRYSHSLGVMETARKMLGQLSRSFTVDPADQTICLCACLLHDLGHGPFSHLFERVSATSHEEQTTRIIDDSDSQVHQILKEQDGQLPRLVSGFSRQVHERASGGIDVPSPGTPGEGEGGGRTQRSANPLPTPRPEYRGREKSEPATASCTPAAPRFLLDILSSQLDADRLDYLLRDNLMTGSRYGDYDLSWLLHALTIDEKSGRLAIHSKGVSALEAYLQSRFHMYRNVYFHKVVRSAEGMVALAIQRARRLAVQERLSWPKPDDVVYKALLGRQLETSQFIELDDVSILQCFKVWAGGSDEPLASLCRGLLYRRLFKTIELNTNDPPRRIQELRESSERTINSAGGNAAYEFFYDEPSDICADDIPVRTTDGVLTTFAAISPLPGAASRQLIFRRFHLAAQWKDLVAQTICQ